MIHSDKTAWAVEFLDLPKATGIPGAKWEKFQKQFLNNQTRFSITNKSRQIAWSWTAALDALVDSVFNPGTPHVFNSINLSEATEKIRYAKQIAAAFDAPIREQYFDFVQESRTTLELPNGARLISFPCRPPRGFPRMRWYADEMAHWPSGLDKEIYTAALPATTRGGGYVRIGSSPLGATGLFWEIVTESLRKYPGYDTQRHNLPWWTIKALCKDTKSAFNLAPLMPTQERVYTFGTLPLIQIFKNMFLEDFQQEYECMWVDESTAWLTWELIKQNQKTEHLWWHARGVDDARAKLHEVKQAVSNGTIEAALTGGIDVGRKHDLTEFMILGKATTGQMPLRFSISLDRVRYDDQEKLFADIISALPFTSVLIDQNGIGAQLAENLGRVGAEGVAFTNITKELWAVNARLQMERGNTPLPVDRDIAYQLHSIKKKTTVAKNNVFDTEKNEKHHADKFWAWALGVYAQQNNTNGDLVAFYG
jgi:phage FluMu gp28-like protein